MGPKETAVFYMRKDRAVRFTPSIHAYDYQIRVPAWDKLPDDALRFELLGQRDDVNLITLDLTQMMWDLLAAHQPYARVTHLADRMKRQLLKFQWRLRTPESAETSAGIVRVEAPREPGERSAAPAGATRQKRKPSVSARTSTTPKTTSTTRSHR
jgi:hypothetical protein